MEEAYILLTSGVGKVRDVFEEVKKPDPVKDVRIITGPYDLIASVEADDLSTLTSAVVKRIRDIDGWWARTPASWSSEAEFL